MAKLSTYVLCGLFFLLLWLPEKGLANDYGGVGINTMGGCFAYCTDKTISSTFIQMDQGESRCFFEGTVCEVGACCKCYNSNTGTDVTTSFDSCERFREQFGKRTNVQTRFGKKAQRSWERKLWKSEIVE